MTNSQKELETLKSGKQVQPQYHRDGALIEGYGPGGHTVIVSKEPEFMRDIAPYFASSIGLVFSHIIYLMTGKLAMPVVILFLGSPIIDKVLPKDNQNLSPKAEKAFYNDKRFLIPLYVLNFLETITWIWALIVLSDKVNIDMYWFQLKPETGWQYFLFCLQWAYFNGINAIGGHELIHRRETVHKIFGTMPYTKFCYSHFLDEHIQGHHQMVATLEDSETSRVGESVYYFYLRSFVQSHYNTWCREVKKIKKIQGDDVSFFTIVLLNKMTMYFVIHTTIFLTIYAIFGWQSVKYQIVYTISGQFMFELINYIEHYGLLRRKDENGIYESINKYHSWNARSSPVFFRLQRHADHHAHSFRPYQILRKFDDAPCHMFDYLVVFFLSLVPPVWWYVMDPRAKAVRDMQEGKKKLAPYNYYDELNDEQFRGYVVGQVTLVIMQILGVYLAFWGPWK